MLEFAGIYGILSVLWTLFGHPIIYRKIKKRRKSLDKREKAYYSIIYE
jgi:hypothetical protein